MRRWRAVAAVIVAVAVVAGIFVFLRNQEIRNSPTASDGVSLNCAGAKAGGVGTLDGGLAGQCGDAGPLPAASIAKAITALVVMNQIGQKNPADVVYTIDRTDISYVVDSIHEDGSGRVSILLGEKLTLQQMLTGMLVPSSNNLADSLAYHVFGSFAEYKQAAQQYLAANGLAGTSIGADASGLDPGTTSTVGDLFTIGQLVMQNDVLRGIVATSHADFPNMANGIDTSNQALGRGYEGIKTGTTDSAGGCLLFAKAVSGQTVIGVVLGTKADPARYDIADRFVKWLNL